MALRDYKLVLDPGRVRSELRNLFGGNEALGEQRATASPRMIPRDCAQTDHVLSVLQDTS
jgi:hypothetical protein